MPTLPVIPRLSIQALDPYPLRLNELWSLLERRDAYGIPPEALSTYLTEPGAFQDDRLDQIDGELRARLVVLRTC